MKPKQKPLFDADAIQPSGKDALRVWHERALICRNCQLCETRTKVIFGTGHSCRPDVAFVGDGPRALDEKEGIPFAGGGGALLHKLMRRVGLDPEKSYFCNLVCCRPPEGNPTVFAEASKACLPLLYGQLRVVQPRVIITLGSASTDALLRKGKTITDMRGKWWEWDGTPVRPTFHPNYLLQKNNQKLQMPTFMDLSAAVTKLRELDHAAYLERTSG